VIGVFGALGRRSSLWPVRFLATAYVEIFRNTPCLLQVFIAYFMVPEVTNFHMSNVVAGTIALSLNLGSYMTEVCRAGLQSIRKEQFDAGASLGLTSTQILRRIVLPQALRNVYPPLINMATTSILTSTLLTGIAVTELLGTALNIEALTFRPIEIFVVITVIFLMLTFGISGLMQLIGRSVFPAHGRL
jgi:polar amino acid transport system permease protein